MVDNWFKSGKVTSLYFICFRQRFRRGKTEGQQSFLKVLSGRGGGDLIELDRHDIVKELPRRSVINTVTKGKV